MFLRPKKKNELRLMRSYACAFVHITQKKKSPWNAWPTQNNLDFYFPPLDGKLKYTFVPCRAMLSQAHCVCGFDVVVRYNRYELYAVTKCMSIVFIQRLEECWRTWWNRTKTQVSGKNLETLLSLGKNTVTFYGVD